MKERSKDLRQASIYREQWGTQATFYVGQLGKLPRKGDIVEVTNELTDEVALATVTLILARTREYVVSFTAQPNLL